MSDETWNTDLNEPSEDLEVDIACQVKGGMRRLSRNCARVTCRKLLLLAKSQFSLAL